MTRALFVLWAAVVTAVYFREAWPIIARGTLGELLFGTRAALALLGLYVIAASVVLLWAGDGIARKRWPWLTAAAVLLLPAVAAAASRAPLPFAGEAAARAITGSIGAALVTFAAWAFGNVALHRARWESRVEGLLFELAAGFGVLAASSGMLAIAGAYTPGAARVLLAAGAIAGGARLILRHRPSAAGNVGSPRQWFLPRAGMDRPWLAIVVMALAATFLAALAPESEYDALWYHLWLPQQWLLHGGPFDTIHEYITLYPLTWELVFGAGLAAGGPVAARLLHFCCLPLLALVAWQTTRRFFPAASPWLSAAITVTVPTVLWEATTAYVDLALAFYVGVALYALLSWREGGERRWFWLAALCLGLGASVKHLGLVMVMLAAVAIAVAPRADRTVRDGAAANHGSRDSISGRVLRAAAIVAAALAIAVPWYLRAWLASGNPVFPELFGVFGASPPLRWDAAAEQALHGFTSRFGIPRTPWDLALLPWTLSMHGARFGGSLGPVFLLLLPVLVAGALRQPRARWLGAITLGYFAVWASPLSSFQLRFLVPIVLPMAVLAGAAVAAAAPGRILQASLAAVLMLNLPPFIALHEGDRHGSSGWLTHVPREVPLGVVLGRQSADEYLRERVGGYGAWQHIDAATPRGARVLVAGARHNFYATREPLSMDALAARPAWSQDEQALTGALRDLGVTHVLVERDWLRTLRPPLPALAGAAFREERLALRYADAGAMVYAVPNPAGGTAAPGRAHVAGGEARDDSRFTVDRSR